SGRGKWSVMKEFLLSLKTVWIKFKRDKAAIVGLAIVILLTLAAIASIWIAPLSVVSDQNLERALQPPSWDHWMGTDQFGRDIALRVLHGARISLFVGFVAVAIGMSIGLVLGTSAGYFGGWWDTIVMRI